MNKNYLKILIPILIVIIIIILIILLILKINSENNSEQNQISEGDPGEEIDFSTTQIENVTEKIDYYTVRNCINSYLNFLNNDSSIYYSAGQMDTDMQKEYIYSLLSLEYIEQNNITVENLLSKINTVNQTQIFVPLKMKVLQKENINKFLAYGVIQNLTDYEFIKEAYFIVNLDYINKTFSIEPINNKYDNIEEIDLQNNDISINSNDNNIYTSQKITNEYVTKEYFGLYKKISLSKPEIIFNMLPEDYKVARFGNLEGFKQYINDNREEILKINLKQYLVNNYEDYIEYVGKDQFGNLYIFNEYKDQTIDIKLDTYTITPNIFVEEYEKASEEKKVQMNIDKFIQMINRHDYITSYNCIAENFKSNYFNTQEKFENYIKNTFFTYNKFEFNSIEQKGSNLYVAKVQLTDLAGESTEVKEINIIMQLKDNLDFEMSFGV